MPKLEFDEEVPEVSGDIGTIPQSPEAVPENKVPHNLLKTPRGVNPAKRAGFYANEKPEVLGKTLEESSSVPKGAVFPVVETTPETVFVEWGTRPPLRTMMVGVRTPLEKNPPSGGGSPKGPGTVRTVYNFTLKEGIAPLDRVADAKVEVFYNALGSVLYAVENLKNVDFSGRDGIFLIDMGMWSLRLFVNDNTFTLQAQASVPSGNPAPADTFFTYVKVTILSESTVVSKLPSECIEGMPLVVNCSIEHGKEEDFAVFDKTFAEMQNYELGDIQFRFNGLKSIKQQFLPGRMDDDPSLYRVFFYDIGVNAWENDDVELVITQYLFRLYSSDEADYSILTYGSSGDQVDDGSGKY